MANKDRRPVYPSSIFCVHIRNIGAQHLAPSSTDKGSQTPPLPSVNWALPPLFSPWLCSFMVHCLLLPARCFSSSFMNAVHHHHHHHIAKPWLMLNWCSLKLHKIQLLNMFFSPGEPASLPMLMLTANTLSVFQLLACNKLNTNWLLHTGRTQAQCMCFCVNGRKTTFPPL